MFHPRVFWLMGMALAVGAIGIAAFWTVCGGRFGRALPDGAIAVRGGEAMRIDPPTGLTHFRQTDPLWSRKAIGGSGESIGAVGCTLCCVAMALTHFGVDTDPSRLNADLIDRMGYTQQGWILWSAVERASGDRVRVTVQDRPTHAVIDANLKAGRLTLAKFHLPLGIPHWVVICGKKGDDYLILDPALKETRPLSFASRTQEIVSIRTLGMR